MFTLATELVDDPVESAPEAVEGNENNAGVAVAGVLKRACEEPENAKVELAKMAKAHEEMKETHTKKVDKWRNERSKEVVICAATAF